MQTARGHEPNSCGFHTGVGLHLVLRILNTLSRGNGGEGCGVVH